jgi:hypothetical protein
LEGQQVTKSVIAGASDACKVMQRRMSPFDERLALVEE